MTTRRGAKGKFSIPSNFGFRRHHRDKKKKKIKKIHTRVCIYVYIRIHKEEEEEEEEILGEIQRRPFRKWWRRVAAKLPSLAAPR